MLQFSLHFYLLVHLIHLVIAQKHVYSRSHGRSMSNCLRRNLFFNFLCFCNFDNACGEDLVAKSPPVFNPSGSAGVYFAYYFVACWYRYLLSYSHFSFTLVRMVTPPQRLCHLNQLWQTWSWWEVLPSSSPESPRHASEFKASLRIQGILHPSSPLLQWQQGAEINVPTPWIRKRIMLPYQDIPY